jgi:hypothetical protein
MMAVIPRDMTGRPKTVACCDGHLSGFTMLLSLEKIGTTSSNSSSSKNPWPPPPTAAMAAGTLPLSQKYVHSQLAKIFSLSRKYFHFHENIFTFTFGFTKIFSLSKKAGLCSNVSIFRSAGCKIISLHQTIATTISNRMKRGHCTLGHNPFPLSQKFVHSQLPKIFSLRSTERSNVANVPVAVRAHVMQ